MSLENNDELTKCFDYDLQLNIVIVSIEKFLWRDITTFVEVNALSCFGSFKKNWTYL